MRDHDQQLGFDSVPERYAGTRETIDLIRDELGDEGFRAYCLGQVIRYTQRAGRKGPAEIDEAKAHWYMRMCLHLRTGSPDPRSDYRETFCPYRRPDGTPGIWPRQLAQDWPGAMGGALGLLAAMAVLGALWTVGAL